MGEATLTGLIEAMCKETPWLNKALADKKLNHKDVEAVYITRMCTNSDDIIIRPPLYPKFPEEGGVKLNQKHLKIFEDRPDLIESAARIAYTKDWIFYWIVCGESYGYAMALPRTELSDKIVPLKI